MRGTSRFPALAALLGAVFILASFMLIVWELGAPFALATSEAGRFQAYISKSVDLPLAESSRLDIVRDCYRLTQSTYARVQPTNRLRALLERCTAFAEATVAAAPTLGFAWAVLGDLRGRQANHDAFNAALLQSQLVTPNEQWIAELRVQIVEENYANANEALRRHEVDDLRMLVASARGIRSIATRYVHDLGFRQRVIDVVEMMSAADQRRFLSEVERAAQRASNV